MRNKRYIRILEKHKWNFEYQIKKYYEIKQLAKFSFFWNSKLKIIWLLWYNFLVPFTHLLPWWNFLHVNIYKVIDTYLINNNNLFNISINPKGGAASSLAQLAWLFTHFCCSDISSGTLRPWNRIHPLSHLRCTL